MVVSEGKVREVAVQIENDITININKEISLALLGIDESLYLIGLVKIVRLNRVDHFLMFGAGVSSGNLGLRVLSGVLESQEV